MAAGGAFPNRSAEAAASRRGLPPFEIASVVDAHLDSGRIQDRSLNGLQLDGGRPVRKVGLAVDACMETLEAAVREECQALLVHHGLFWGAPLALAGRHGAFVRKAMREGISLFAWHLPLDAHPVLGNNARIVRVLGLSRPRGMGLSKGTAVALLAESKATPFEAFLGKVEAKIGKPLHVIRAGESRVGRVAICSGRGGFVLEEAARAGAQVLVTGDADHTLHHAARELGVSVISAGHYQTEVFGVRALGAWLGSRLGLESVFLDVPTGL